MPPIVLATANPHKIAELRAIFDAHDIPVVGLHDLHQPPGGFREPSENGKTFEENATIKALAYAAQTHRVCLADDSGLEIDALEGRPGVISSHYSTDGRETGLSRVERDSQNNDRVLRELAGIPPGPRSARFVCVMALAAPTPLNAGTDSSGGAGRPALRTVENGIVAIVRGTFEGRIGADARGVNGFGYDPLFLVAPEYTRSSAELPPEEKNRLSHRAAAAKLMAAEIRRLSDTLK